MAAIVLVSTLLTSAVFPVMNLWGIVPDLLLICMVSMLLLERTAMPILFTAAGLLLMDALFAPAMGYYTIPYVVIGLIVYAVVYKRYIDQTFLPAVILAAAFFLKEVLTAALSAFLGYEIRFGYVLVRFVLPEMLLNAVLMFILYHVFRRLYRCSFMRPLKNIDDDFLGSL